MVDMEPWSLVVHEDKQPNPIEVLFVKSVQHSAQNTEQSQSTKA